MLRITIRTISSFLSGIFLLFILFLLTTCGKATNTSPETGSLSFAVVWEDSNQKVAPMLAPLDCTTTGISTIEAIVYDQGNNRLAAGGPWPCSAHQGEITGVPVGVNRTVVIIAENAGGSIIYQGTKSSISVIAGQTSSCGEIAAYSCVPTISGISSGDRQLTITWQDVSGASSYNLYWSTTTGVSQTVHSGVFSGLTTKTYTHAPLTNGTTYYYVLTSVNAYGESAKSAEVNATPGASSNNANTLLLRGKWHFIYTIISTFTDDYSLATMSTDTNSQGGYYISGTNQYGQSVIASYWPSDGNWSLLDDNYTTIEKYYSFYTNGNTILPNSCYYQIDKSTNVWSACFPLSGSKISTTPAPALEIYNSPLMLQKSQAAYDETVLVPPIDESTMDKYLQLEKIRNFTN